MAKKAFQGFAMVLAVILVAFVGYTAGAGSGSAGSDSEGGDRSYWQRLHSVGLRLHKTAAGHGHHGGGEFGHHMAEVVERLDLSPTQAAHLEAIHRSLKSLGSGAAGSMTELHLRLVEQFERGAVEAGALRPAIDLHLAEMQRVAYSATDELVALVNSLDADQREIMLEHLQGSTGGLPGRGR